MLRRGDGASAMPAPAGGRSSKAAKVLRKSLTGSALLAVVVLLLFWTDKSPNGEPILYATAALLLGAIVEASRMGSLATRDLFPALVIPVAWAELALLERVRGERGGADLLGAYLFCGGLAASAYAIGHMWKTRNAFTRLVVYALGAWAVVPTGDIVNNGRIVFAIVGVVAIAVLSFRPNGLRGLAMAAGLAILIVPPIASLWWIWKSWSTGGLVAFLLCAKIGDTAGYYVGTALGKHHPFPRISPGKTVEGCIGSFVAGAAAGACASAGGLLPGGAVAGLAAGALVNLAAQAGDLLESWVKRKAGVKDSSGLFGPSGGLLDQLDSLLLAVPVALVAWSWLVPPSH
jgi:CDP-diglyceride synthetase